MKPLSYVPLFLCLFLTQHSFSQDIISLKDGSTLNVKVIEIGTEEIKYKKSTNPDGPSYSIKKDNINKITYPDGQEEMINGEYLKRQNIALESIIKKHEYAITEGKGIRVPKSIKYDRVSRTKNESTDSEQKYQKTIIAGYGIKVHSSSGTILRSIEGSWNLRRLPGGDSVLIEVRDPISRRDTTILYSDFSCLLALLMEDRQNINYIGEISKDGITQHYFRIKMEQVVCELWLNSQTFLPTSYKIGELTMNVISSEKIGNFWFPKLLRGTSGNQILTTQYSNFKMNGDFKSEFTSAKKLDSEIKSSENSLLLKRTKLSIDDFLEFKYGDTIDNIIDYLKEKNINYAKESLKNEIDLIRIGQKKGEKIILNELPDMDYDYIVFGFWKEALIVVKFKYSVVDATETQHKNIVIPSYKDRCIRMDAMIATKFSKKPAELKTWSKKYPFHAFIRPEPSLTVYVEYSTVNLLGTQNLVLKSGKVSTGGSEEFF